MSKIQRDRDHLIYAAVHQDKDSYIQAVKIHSVTSITKIILFGLIIYFSKSEFLPVISALIKTMN
jgi:hypothetical protein